MAMLQIKNLQGKKPHFTKSGNIKLGKNMWVWSTMKGSNDETRYVNDFKGECSGTCGKFCECCTKDCYVNHSYRYGSVIKGHAINTTWIKNDMENTFVELEKQIDRSKKKPDIIRINQSGELLSEKDLLHWMDLAKKHPKTTMYLYTKNYSAVKKAFKTYQDNNKSIPFNLTILLSIWHDVGVKEWESLKSYDNIKCFIYDDGELSLTPQTYCKAYDEKGHLNHDVTCDKCRKCFNRNTNHKLIGCKAH